MKVSFGVRGAVVLLMYLGLGALAPLALAQGEGARENLHCGLGRSFDLDFCYDPAVLTPASPLGGFAYVLTTEDRAHLILVSIAPSDTPPILDLATLQAAAGPEASLPLGPDHAFASTVTFEAGDAQSYSAILNGPGGFGFGILAMRQGAIPGGIVRLSLVNAPSGLDSQNGPEVTEASTAQAAFAQVARSFRLL